MLEIISNRRKTVQTRYLFHHLNGQKLVQPNAFLEMAWADAGCVGPVRFSQPLSSVNPQVSTLHPVIRLKLFISLKLTKTKISFLQANKHLNTELRKDATKSTCHDVNAAEQVYVDITQKLAINVSKLDTGSKGLEAGKTGNPFKTKESARTPSTTSSKEKEVVDLDGETEFSDTSTAKTEHDKLRRKRRGSAQPQPPSKVSKRNMSYSPQLKTLIVKLRRLDDCVVKRYQAKNTTRGTTRSRLQ